MKEPSLEKNIHQEIIKEIMKRANQYEIMQESLIRSLEADLKNNITKDIETQSEIIHDYKIRIRELEFTIKLIDKQIII